MPIQIQQSRVRVNDEKKIINFWFSFLFYYRAALCQAELGWAAWRTWGVSSERVPQTRAGGQDSIGREWRTAYGEK